MKNSTPKIPTKYLLKLYVTGKTVRSQEILKTLKQILDEDYNGIYSLEVIDVIQHPQLAEEDKILATPTLIKILPPPVARIIGDLNNKEKILLGLDFIAIR
jgi:circadian clock protein KaiB